MPAAWPKRRACRSRREYALPRHFHRCAPRRRAVTIHGTRAMTESLRSAAPDDRHGAHVHSDVAAEEFLTFALGAEEYGVEILKVQEIRGYDTVTRLPDAPDYIKGVINLRGTIVPVVDMGRKFHLASA